MISGPALPCPKCRRVLKDASWHDAEAGTCEHCRAEFTFTGFPALFAGRRQVLPQATLVTEQAACFYHAGNQAEAVCDSCGRFLCPVCALEFTGRTLCPACLAQDQTKDVEAIPQRVLYDGIALAVATLPVLAWPVTLVTSPLAVGLAIFGWRRPCSLVRGHRVKLVVAGLLGLVQAGAWITFGTLYWLKK